MPCCKYMGLPSLDTPVNAPKMINHVLLYSNFKQPINILCEFIPQTLFLLAMFGYLVALIFVKWVYFSPSESACAPSLLLGELFILYNH